MRGPEWVCVTSRLVDAVALCERDEDGEASDGSVDFEFEVGADVIGGEADLGELLVARLLVAGRDLEFGVELGVESDIALEFAPDD